jgi:V/A-type H+-transporting ATPase subunit D
VDVIKKQIEILERELRVTTQRVNLFEKVKIPECMDNIRKISIYLGDQMANAVGISKVAKKKIEESVLQESFV